jgi:GT2 family glycosyltransferase
MNWVDVAVCTIYANRKSHLQNLVKGLIASSVHPKQLTVVCMNDRLPELPATPFSIDTAAIKIDNNCLPLAAARNKAASLAKAEKLIFLDVDCISDRHLIEIFDYHLQQEDALYVGSVRYLHDGWQADKSLDLNERSSPHKLQGTAVKDKDRVIHPYELFWSLCFSIRKDTFEQMGGFDTDYIGYGAEDTDFSFTARSQNLPLYKVSASAYHQFHPSYDPPLNHLEEIVSNARVFYRKWNILPMQKWLDRFAEMGYIKLNGYRIEIIKLPTEADIAACIKNF